MHACDGLALDLIVFECLFGSDQSIDVLVVHNNELNRFAQHCALQQFSLFPPLPPNLSILLCSSFFGRRSRSRK